MTKHFPMPQKKAEDFVNAGWEKQVTESVVANKPKTKNTTIIDGELCKRLTIDVPESLHRRARIGCVQQGIVLAEVVRQFLKKEFPEI